jgi:hypothetical protein
MHKCQQSLDELFNDALRTFGAFEERYKDIGCQVCKVLISNCFWEGAATKTPEKIKSVGFVSGARLCHEHKMSATTNSFSFAKNEWPEKARNVLYNVLLLSFEPGPNPTRIQTLSGLPGPGPYRPLLASP